MTTQSWIVAAAGLALVVANVWAGPGWIWKLKADVPQVAPAALERLTPPDERALVPLRLKTETLCAGRDCVSL